MSGGRPIPPRARPRPRRVNVSPATSKRPGTPIWYARTEAAELDPPEIRLVGYANARCPDASIVEVGDLDPAQLVEDDRVVTVRLHAERVIQVEVADAAAPGAPPLWLVEIPELGDERPAMSLVAFEGPQFEDGTVVDNPTFADLPVPSRNQVAAIRWWVDSGHIHQIYVAPERRRQHVAVKLIYSAAGYRAARGWASIKGGGERTDLGEAVVAAAPAPWRHRIEPRTWEMPPMTPVEKTIGVPARNLYPDRSGGQSARNLDPDRPGGGSARNLYPDRPGGRSGDGR